MGATAALRAADVAISRSSEMIPRCAAPSTSSAGSDEQLRLQRTYTLFQREPALHINDDHHQPNDVPPRPLMILYHINIGFPIAQRAGAAAAYHPTRPLRPQRRGAQGPRDRWPVFDAAVASREEQVYFHHVKWTAGSTRRFCLQKGDFGFQIAWDAARRMALLHAVEHTAPGYVTWSEH